MRVTVYSTPTCPYCHQVKQYLQTRGISFDDRDVSRDAAAAEEMVRLSGQRGVPVILIGDQVVVGFDRARLDAILSSVAPSRGLGVAVADAADMASRGKTDLTSGAYVGRVKAGSVAEQAGLRVGDVIVSLAGHPVHSAASLETLVARLPKGRAVQAEYVRDGRRSTVTLEV